MLALILNKCMQLHVVVVRSLS
jgi:UvrD/REP helicase N-terminal domain